MTNTRAATPDVELPDDEAAQLAARPHGYLRDREDEDAARVSFVELFFDLVFVFGITQLAAYLADNITPEGIVRVSVMFVAVWWLWINTAWATNRLDPDRALVRLVIFVLLGAGLVFSTGIPVAFEERAMAFATAYVGIQVARSLFMVWALRTHEEHGEARHFLRVGIWFALSGVLWIAGALAVADARVVLWLLAAATDLLVPWIGFRLPGLGRSSTHEWDIEGEHLAERCALFIIIALGESLLVTGGRLGEAEWNAAVWAAFGVAVMGSLAMWWIYFDTGAKRGTRAFEEAHDSGRLARFAYTYVHMPIVAGIVVAAVGDKFLLAHPGDPADWPAALALLGGPALFLLGNFLFKNATSRRWPISHVIGLVLLGAGLFLAGSMTILGVAAYGFAALLVVAALERALLYSRTADRQGLK
ncbi:low temperature requirement protein A [Paracoccus sp. MC1862]|uniref:low temperature requirement protein A n=1 Tax=Paracoccus sp. MC1862 TaxID=2760307 RepID=UPI001C72929E|nr:low temperature requirement protein A [Paracoccus sp. MC1862]